MALAEERGGVSYTPTPEEQLAAQQAAQYAADNAYSTGNGIYSDYAYGGAADKYGTIAPPPGYMTQQQTVGYYADPANASYTTTYAPVPANTAAPAGGYAPVANSALAYPAPPPRSQQSQNVGGFVQGLSDAIGSGIQRTSDDFFRLLDDASRVLTRGSTPPPPLPSPGLGMGGPIPGSGPPFGGEFEDGPLNPVIGFHDAGNSGIGPPGAGGLPGGPQMPFTFGPSVQQNGPRGTGGLPSGPPMPFTFAPPEDDRGYDPGFPPLIPGVVPVPPGGVPLPIPIPIPPGGVPIVPIPPVGPPGAGGLPGGPTRMIDIIPPLPPGGGAPPPPAGPPGPVMPRNPAPTPPAPAPAPAPNPTPAPAPAPAPGGYGGPPMQAAPTQGTPLITPSGEVYGTLETKPNGQTVVKRLPKGRPNRWNIPQLPTTDPRQMLIDMGIANQALPPGITQRVPPGFALPPGFLMPEWAEQTPLPPPLYDQLRGGMGARGTQQQGGAGRRNRDRR